MKKNPNSPPNRLPNSPHPLKKVKKSTSQQVNEFFWGVSDESDWSDKSDESDGRKPY